jgi:hypothetical protein
MNAPQKTVDRAGNWLRWAARGVGSLVAGYWLFIALAYAIGGHEPRSAESLTMTGLIVSSTAGTLIAWWRARIGGIVLLVIAVAHSVFALIASGHHRGVAVLIAGGPFLLAGLLFLASWWKTRR